MIKPWIASGAATAALMLLLPLAPAAAQQCPAPGSLAGDASPLLAPIRVLADDAYAGRRAGSTGERCAGEYIAARFAELGLLPAGTDGYFQEVPLASVLNPHAAGGTGRNVAALLPGSDASLREEYVVIGAHYDHLGHGGAGSLVPGDSAIHNGADDNASGVAAMLDAAAKLAADPPARSVLFIAFTGEESGLLGSAHWVAEPTRSLDAAIAMLNLDMVGRLEGRPLIVYGTGTAREWPTIVEGAARTVGLEISAQPEGYGPSDHTSFYARGVPVLHFFSNTHPDYHRPSDDWERIDAEGLQQVSDLVGRVARVLADQQGRLAVVVGAGEPPRGTTTSGYGAWLGTVPDFAAVDRGVRLGGVTPGSPAEAAGVQAGDILVGMAGEEVADLQAMTDVLRAHRPGDTVELVLLRDGQTIRTRATLGSRRDRSR